MQEYSSKFTSVNTKKLPAIYNQINLAQIKKRLNTNKPTLLDYGCGREISHIKKFLEPQEIMFFGYDKFWKNDKELLNRKYNIIICTCVLNVINSEVEICDIIKWITEHSDFWFFRVYEGDKSGYGHVSKKDCWQRNETTWNYLKYFPRSLKPKIKRNIISNYWEVL